MTNDIARHSPPDASDGEEEICLCFHVPRNKIIKYIRLHRPRLASELANCYGAGTGCGWCVPFLAKLHEQMMAGEEHPSPDLSPEEYQALRAAYRREKGLEN